MEEETKDPEILEAMWGDEVDFEAWPKEFLDYKFFEDPDFDPDVVLERVPRTDIIAGRAIKYKVGKRLSYVAATRTWYVWDGRIHVPTDGDYIPKHLVYRFFDSIVTALKEVTAYYDREARRYVGSQDVEDKKKLAAINEKRKKVKEYEKYRDNIGSNRGATGLVSALETTFHRDSDYFDNDEDYFVTRNCVFSTKEFTEEGWPKILKHSPDRPVSKYFDASWDPSAYDRLEGSKFMQFLSTSTEGGNREVIDYLQMVTGAAFLGRNKLRTIINLKGPPSSGKSLFLESLFNMGKAGAGYCAMPNSIAITRQPQNWEQSRFRGRRMIGVSEPDTGKEVDDDFLKRFTGDVWVETRNLREKSHGWAPQGVLFIASNDYLKINTRDRAIVDRVQIVSFPYNFVPNPNPNNPLEKQRNVNLTDDLQEEEERSNILMWIVQGMMKFHAAGEQLDPPAAIKEASDQVVSEGSAATRWISSEIDQGTLVREVGEEVYHHMKLSDAWSDFQIWNAMNNEHSRLSKTFFENDIAQWYNIEKHAGDKYIVGLRRVNQMSNDQVSNKEYA